MTMLRGFMDRNIFRLPMERLAATPLFMRIARGAFWSVAAGVVSRTFGLLTAIIIGRMIGRVSFGELGIVQSTVVMLSTFAGFGLGSMTTKYVAEYRFQDPKKALGVVHMAMTVAIMTGLGMMIAALLMSQWLAVNIFNNAAMARYLASGSVLVLVTSVGTVLFSALSGYEDFRTIAKINVSQGIFSTVLAVLLVRSYQVQGAIIALIAGVVIGIILCARVLYAEYRRNGLPLSAYSAAIDWGIIGKYAVPALVSALLVTPTTWATNTVLVNQRNGYAEFGLFTAANQWRMGIIFVLSSLTSGLIPVFSETHSRQDRTDFKKAIAFNYRISWSGALPVAIAMIMWGDALAGLFGKQFNGAGPIIGVLAAAVYFQIIANTVGTVLAGSGKMWTATLMNTGWAAILVIATLLFVPRYGALGLAYAYLGAYILHCIWVLSYAELRLVRMLTRGQWGLVGYSLLLLAASLWLYLSEHLSFAGRFLLFALACLPLYREMKKMRMPAAVQNIESGLPS